MGNIYNAIYSVKGGCGKTAFSILLSYYLSEKLVKRGKVCLVDIDIMGSSMLSSFLPFPSVEKLPDYINRYKFTNQIVDVGKLDDTSVFFVNTNDLEKAHAAGFSVSEDSDKIRNIGFDIIFCSPKSSDINKFRIGEEGGFDTDILHQMFSSGFCTFINNKNNFGSRKNIVFDMPPGSDGFSSVVFNSVFKKSNTVDKTNYIGTEKDIRNLFFIINLDYGHISTVLREFETLVQKSKIKFPDNIFIVINSTTSMDELSFTEYADKRHTLLAEKIRQMSIGLSESEYKSIYFIFSKFNQKYSEALYNGNGLAKTHLSEIFKDIEGINVFGMPDSCEEEGRELFDIMIKKR